MATTILVTGVSSYLGAGVARDLAARDDVGRVIGVDVRAPRHPLGRAEFLRTDVRNPILGRTLRQAEVDTVVHFGAAPVAGSASARASAREASVIGTMQLVGACQAQPGLRHMVLASTGSVYGASATTPAVVTEDHPVNASARAGHVRDAIEVETYVRALERRRPDVGVSVLRLAHVFGTRARSAMTNYLRSPVVPVPFGYDGRIQGLHEDDAVGAIVTAAVTGPVDVVNVAADGVLTLRQAIRIGRRPSVPVLTTTGRALGTLSRWVGRSRLDADHIDYVMYGRCLDTTRMREVLRYEPAYTTRAAYEWFARETWGVDPSFGTAGTDGSAAGDAWTATDAETGPDTDPVTDPEAVLVPDATGRPSAGKALDLPRPRLVYSDDRPRRAAGGAR